MIPGPVDRKVDLLDALAPFPSDRCDRAVEPQHGAALGVLDVDLLVEEPPLDAVALGDLALLGQEHVDMGRLAEPRTPFDDAAMLVGQPPDLPALAVPADPHDAIVGVARNPQPRIVARALQTLAFAVEAGHLFLLSGHAGRGQDLKPMLFRRDRKSTRLNSSH